MMKKILKINWNNKKWELSSKMLKLQFIQDLNKFLNIKTTIENKMVCPKRMITNQQHENKNLC